VASGCTSCGKYHWAGGCAQPEIERARQDIDRAYATFEQAFWLASAALAREFAKILRDARVERGADR